MRDPRGSVSAAEDHIVRELREPLPAEDFLRQPLARELVREQLLVDFELQGDRRIIAPRVAWVSQPSEWCRAQLLDAAMLTLDVAERALAAGFELKDASAWNVIYDGSQPVFCDHLSFEPITRREWRALGQFARHFTLPLLIARKRGLPVHEQFRMFRDGVTLQLARELCGWRMWVSRAAPLLLAGGKGEGGAASPPRPERGPTLHANLLRFARFTLPPKTRAAAPCVGSSASRWSDYVLQRDHYSAGAVARKRLQVSEWLEKLRPAWVLDLGSNTGEFSRLAAQSGSRVIAVDSDHDCIEQLYLSAREHTQVRAIHPVLAQLDDLGGGRGWRGREAPGLVQRLAGHGDLVMMLGLVHHLMIAAAIPVLEIAAFAAELTRRSLILELVPERDPMFRQLADQYGRADAVTVCGEAAQLSAFNRYFGVTGRCELEGSARTLLLLEKKAA